MVLVTEINYEEKINEDAIIIEAKVNLVIKKQGENSRAKTNK